jgi:hypothetical protein
MRLFSLLPALALLTSPVIAAAPPASAIAAQPATSLPGWLAGTWAREDGAAWAEELWTAPRGGQMLGLSRDGFGPDVTTWSQERIERSREGAPVLVVQKEGGAAVRYPLAVASESAIEFANAAQSYPQRIRYWREGQLLMIEASRMDGSEAKRWNYRPVSTFVE